MIRISPQSIGQSASVDPLLVDSKRAAELLGISEKTLYNLTRAGEIKRRQIGRSVRYSLTVLREFAEGKGTE